MSLPDDLVPVYGLGERSTPSVRVNFIATLDGASTRSGTSGALGNDDDKRVFDTLRQLCDVILVGAGTVAAEGYSGVRVSLEHERWRVAHGLERQPPVAVVSASLSLGPRHPVFQEAVVRPLVITAGSSDAGRRAALGAVADVLVCGDDTVDPVMMLDALASRGLAQVLCEGGPALFGSLIEADLVDELCLTLSPVLESGDSGRIASGERAAARGMTLVHAIPAGDMVFLRYRRSR
ncbi:MAG: hypothetical protein RI885_2593 [Actinomycetota bacterium]|jgi:riboflavin biosynthesis pyrimidine reductase